MYELTSLFFYRPIFMLELLVAETFLFFYFRPRKGLAWRLPLAILFCFGISFAIPVVAFNSFFSSLLFLTMFAATVLAAWFVFDEPIKKILFFGVAAYTVQHVAQVLYELISLFVTFDIGVSAGDMYSSGNFGTGSPWYLQALQYLFYIQIFFMVYGGAFMYISSRLDKEDALQLDVSMVVVFVILLTAINIIFSSMVIYSLPKDVDDVTRGLLQIFNIICCIISLVLLFELPRRKKAETDLDILEQLRERERAQYESAKANIEEMNIKCHDLKHIVGRLSEGSVDQSVVGDMRKIVEEYDAVYKTENAALNVVLTEKGGLCRRQEITFSSIIDAPSLSFLSELDIYALFGNILDNAIEATSKLEKDKRIIGLTTERRGNFVNINVYNTFDGTLQMEKGLPLTRKSDKRNHGFGLKSIKNIVEKYGGEMTIKAQNGLFELNILLQTQES